MTKSLYGHLTGHRLGYQLDPILLRFLGPVPAAILAVLPFDSTMAVSSLAATMPSHNISATLDAMIACRLIATDGVSVWVSPDIDQALIGLCPDIPLMAWKTFEEQNGAGYAKSCSHEYAQTFGLSESQIRALGIASPFPSKPKGDRKPKEGYVYLLEAFGTGRFKIGVTTAFERRMDTLQKQSPFPLQCIARRLSCDIYQEELAWHQEFSRFRVHGEWFELDAAAVEEFRSRPEMKVAL